MPLELRTGESLRILRESAGLTIADLADATGVTPERIVAVEAGSVAPSPAFIANAMRAIGTALRDHGRDGGSS